MPRLARRLLRWLAVALAGLLGLVAVLLAAVLVFANTAPGRRLIENEVAALTGGTVRVGGLAGRFPDALRVRSIAIADTRGVWLTLGDLRLDWHPLQLASLAIHVTDVEAATVAVARLPAPSPAHPAPPPAKGGGLNLPFSLRIDRIALPDVALAAPVAGHALALGVHGHASIGSLQPVLHGPDLADFPATDLALDLADLSGRGRYRLEGEVRQGGISLRIGANEQAGGLLATLAGSGEISPLALDLALDGPRGAEALHLNLDAGQLKATADGLIDLAGEEAMLTVAAHAPAMQPVAGVSWQGVALDAKLHGKLRRLAADGHLLVTGLQAGGASVARIDADLSGASGPVSLRAALAGVRIPGPRPDLLAAAPVTLDAVVHLEQPTRPVELHLSHPLVMLAASLRTAGGIAGHVDLALPDLAPLAAAGGIDLAGHAALGADLALAGADASAAVAGKLALTGGQKQAVALLGPDATLAVSAAKHGSALTLRSLAVTGRALALQASGTDDGGRLDAHAHLVLPDLSAAAPPVAGHLTVDAAATGPVTDLAAMVHAAGAVGTGRIQPEALTLDVAATHLPKTPDAKVTLAGQFDRAPADLRAEAARDAAGATAIHLTALSWRSLHGVADLVLAPGARLPTGTLSLSLGRLADLSRVAGQPLAGSLSARLAETASGARVDLSANGLAAAGARVGRLTLAGTVADPAADPDLALRLDATGIARGANDADLHATARGRLAALAVTLAGSSPNLAGAPATLDSATTIDVPRHDLVLARLVAAWHGETVRLAAPARIAWAPAVTLGDLRLDVATGAGGGANPVTVTVNGRVSPTLQLVASVRGVTPALAAPFAPTLAASGRIDADAHLGGTPASPTGTVHVTAAALHLRTGAAAALPPADLDALATLAGTAARLRAHLAAGARIDLALAGTAPIRGGGPLDVGLDGRVDLAVANPILEQSGRHLSGSLTLAATARGTLAHPALGGTITLANGDLQDFTQGAHLSDIAAAIALAGPTVRVDRFTAHAGAGTLAVSGAVGALAPGIPVDLTITMNRASPIASDLLTAVLDADVRVAGEAAGRLAVGGRVTIDRADINIPNGLPSSVATLHVIKPGERPPPPTTHATAARVIALDLTLAAPGQVFVRGHGIDAVLGGTLHAGGTSTAPVISGGFHLRRGTLALAGTTLNFTRGDVGFDGTTNGHLDPTLDFLAESTVDQYTADLAVTGYASKPKITLSSTPALPQDQVLGLLLFGSTTASLSPFQIAEIATALASLSGSGGGFDPIGSVRNTLGLDRLTVGSSTNTANSNGASIEGGKYVTKRVYVGARESTGGGGTQALVQIDITKRLKAFTTVGTGGTVTGATTPENDPGSNVGLKYQFRY